MHMPWERKSIYKNKNLYNSNDGMSQNYYTIQIYHFKIQYHCTKKIKERGGIMSIMSMLKARKAVSKAGKGEIDEAIKLYEEAYNDGLTDMRSLLHYSVLLIRKNQFQKARDLFVKIQNYPMQANDRTQMYVNYATVVFKLGETEKAIALLERQHEQNPNGLIYQTLGYLYVEMGDEKKALAFNQEACKYDEEDPICLDNLGQTYYRLLNDKKTAKKWFDLAIAEKPNQLDTLYFLTKYDLEKGDKEEAIKKIEKLEKARFSPLNYANAERVAALRASL